MKDSIFPIVLGVILFFFGENIGHDIMSQKELFSGTFYSEKNKKIYVYGLRISGICFVILGLIDFL